MTHTTAFYRTEAMAEAKVLNWFRAALLMEEAIKVYPTRGALADLDIAKMRQKVVAWRAMLTAEAA